MEEYRRWDQPPDSKLQKFMRMRRGVLVNTIIVAVNILIFLLTELTGSSLDGRNLVRWGAAQTQLIGQQHEYYRLFTCMFLHFGIEHLGNNMLVLVFLGDSLEREVGRLRYLLIYLIGGLGASGFSFYMEMSKGESVVSAGASGAIFAVVGALVIVVIRNKGKAGGYSTRQILFFAALSLYAGWRNAGVDNAAHLGGLICGLLLGIILCHRKKRLPYQ